MRKLFLASAALAMLSAPAAAEDVKVGVILGFTGPIESIVADMAPAAEMAMTEVNDAGGILDGKKLVPVRGDSTCVGSDAATATAERLITSDKIAAIVGGDCSGVTTAMLKNVAMPKGVLMISPSATSPALSTLPDNDLFFRTAPSDARQGEIVAAILGEKGIKSAAMTYTNNDYGKGLSDSIKENVTKAGGKITISAAHEDGKGDYSAEVAALAAAGGDILIVAGYLDQGGKGIIQAALDSGAFSQFYLPDGMVGDALPAAIGDGLNGSIGAVPGTDSPGVKTFAGMAEKAGFKPGPFSAETYDSAALIMLAMEAAGSTDSNVFKEKVMDVANAPGEQIFPGELAKAIEILKSGGDIDYVGASAVELVGAGESAGNYRQIEIKDGAVSTVGYR